MIVKIVIFVRVEELLQKARNFWDRNTFRAMLLFYLTTPSSMALCQLKAQPSRLMFLSWAGDDVNWKKTFICLWPMWETQKYHCFRLFDTFGNFLLWPVIKCMCRGRYMYISNWKSNFRSAQFSLAIIKPLCAFICPSLGGSTSLLHWLYASAFLALGRERLVSTM